jgi:hypothetical protein
MSPRTKSRDQNHCGRRDWIGHLGFVFVFHGLGSSPARRLQGATLAPMVGRMKTSLGWALAGFVLGWITSGLVWLTVSFIKWDFTLTDQGLRAAIVCVAFMTLLGFIIGIFD